MTPDEQAIRDLIAAWCRATEAGDTAALAPLMADDMLFFVPGREPFGKREFLGGSDPSAAKQQISIQANIKELCVSGGLGYCWLNLAVTVTQPDNPSAPPRHMSGNTLGIYRREASGRWVLARDANFVK